MCMLFLLIKTLSEMIQDVKSIPLCTVQREQDMQDGQTGGFCKRVEHTIISLMILYEEIIKIKSVWIEKKCDFPSLFIIIKFTLSTAHKKLFIHLQKDVPKMFLSLYKCFC